MKSLTSQTFLGFDNYDYSSKNILFIKKVYTAVFKVQTAVNIFVFIFNVKKLSK